MVVRFISDRTWGLADHDEARSEALVRNGVVEGYHCSGQHEDEQQNDWNRLRQLLPGGNQQVCS